MWIYQWFTAQILNVQLFVSVFLCPCLLNMQPLKGSGISKHIVQLKLTFWINTASFWGKQVKKDAFIKQAASNVIRLHGVISQKVDHFKTTGEKIPNPTYAILFCSNIITYNSDGGKIKKHCHTRMLCWSTFTACPMKTVYTWPSICALNHQHTLK